MRFVFLNLSKLIAPFMPFIAENIWQKVTKNDFKDSEKSVHLESWPSFEFNEKNKEVLEKMSIVRQVVELGLAKRDEAKIKVRQMLSQAIVSGPASKNINDQNYLDLIKDELNVQNVKWQEVADNDNLSVELDLEITPELKQEGLKRDLVRLINMLRKDYDFSVNDQAKIYLSGVNTEIKSLIDSNGESIKKDTLSEELLVVDDLSELSNKKEVLLDGEKINLAIEKI
jgi:isoleucyl-tRNA synthetase